MSSPFDTCTDLTICGGPVRLYRAGDTGPPLLLLHGAMLDTGQGVWRDVVGPLAVDHRVHVIDLPRHGGSRPWKGLLDDAFYRRFLLELLDRLELPRVALLGLSMGGGVAVGFALDHPDRVSALVPIGPGGIGRRRPYQFFTWATMRVPGLLRLCSWILARFPGYLRSAMATQLTAGTATPGFDRIIALAVAEARAKNQHGEKALDDWQIESYGPRAMRLDHTPELHRLRAPTLWVRGANDELVGAAEIAAAHAATPDSRYLTIADAGHIVTYDQPEEFVDRVREFLAEVL
ncbi:alpha/beta hydrolase [Mycolicibacterium chitae]|uniref:Peroxidase n=1 Tax=Mycolicibacterium chitae TaxID=1792 RepID=A0A448IBZ7_MYCCI|nr:alpha/beta hydrolase [Mycolicibacterium chitae]MCV7108615.1 alpha/beta hydrolase [Mycolicibacterium chitae]BBZ01119.1 alpha/beta hydrolase [Mycolicibacterium chitae]VEG49958.1 peroxidase [Mycolicibacterium chitae]